MYSKIAEEIRETTTSIVTVNEPMAKQTYMRVGGNAELFILCGVVDELILIIQILKKNKVPFFMMGDGSNIIVRDGGIEGAVIKFSEMGDAFVDATPFRESCVGAPAFMSKRRFLDMSIKSELSGAEFLAGIPGTLGGGIRMNAGTERDTFANIIKSIEVYNLDNFTRERVDLDRIIFSYRDMGIDGIDNFLILSAIFELKREDKDTISERIGKYRKKRAAQPHDFPNAGSIFKNPKGSYSGDLIEKCGLKGYAIGGARVSDVHANFIVNYNSAKASDIISLMDLIKREVKQKFKIDLIPEVQIVGKNEAN